MSKARKASLMALAALVLVGIWVDITGYLDVFSSPSATSHSQEIAHYACYAGRIAMAAAFLLFPRQLNCPIERSVPLMLCCMVGGTMLYSFGFHQSCSTLSLWRQQDRRSSAWGISGSFPPSIFT